MSKGIEYERKFLVKHDGWKQIPPQEVIHITQNYLPEKDEHGLVATLLNGPDQVMIGLRHNGHFLGAAMVDPERIDAFGRANLGVFTDPSSEIEIGERVEARIRHQCDEQGRDEFVMTLKAKTKNKGERFELEFDVPSTFAERLLPHCPNFTEKTRYVIPQDGFKWEVDVFHGANSGLETVEIEIKDGKEPTQLPDWIGREITSESKYGNASLARIPYKQWARDNAMQVGAI